MREAPPAWEGGTASYSSGSSTVNCRAAEGPEILIKVIFGVIFGQWRWGGATRVVWEMASFICVRLEITPLAGFDEGGERIWGMCKVCGRNKVARGASLVYEIGSEE